MTDTAADPPVDPAVYDENLPRHDVPRGGRSGFTVIDGRQVHYLEWGHRRLPPLVCLHGGGQTAYMYEDLGDALGRRHHVLAPDLPSHGDSGTIGEMDRHALAATIGPLMDHFGIDRAAFVGASLGGIVAITFAAARPERVAAIALIDIGHQLQSEGVRKIIRFMAEHESFGSLQEAAAAVAEYLPSRKPTKLERLTRNLRQRPDGRWEWKHSYGRTLREGGALDRLADDSWKRVVDGLDEDAARLECPVLVTRGQRSDVLSDDGAEAIAEIIPDSRLEVIGGAGHLAAGDNARGTVDLISDFLTQVTPGSDSPA